VTGRADIAGLFARPIAHRGLHDAARGVIENTLSAAEAAAQAGYAIECDVQLSADGEAMVFHDFALDRLSEGHGRLDACMARELAALRLRATQDRIVPLAAFLAAVASRVPAFCEIKSRFDGDMRLADRVACCARDYNGPLAAMSFDPEVVAHLRASPDISTPLGVVAQLDYSAPGAEWSGLAPDRQRALAQFLHFPRTRPDFLFWRADDLPAAIPLVLREGLGVPVAAWTVRSPVVQARVRPFCDQVVFEGFRP
jgi:glycerophosphoryl diester phosphodiesterase